MRVLLAGCSIERRTGELSARRSGYVDGGCPNIDDERCGDLQEGTAEEVQSDEDDAVCFGTHVTLPYENTNRRPQPKPGGGLVVDGSEILAMMQLAPHRELLSPEHEEGRQDLEAVGEYLRK